MTRSRSEFQLNRYPQSRGAKIGKLYKGASMPLVHHKPVLARTPHEQYRRSDPSRKAKTANLDPARAGRANANALDHRVALEQGTLGPSGSGRPRRGSLDGLSRGEPVCTLGLARLGGSPGRQRRQRRRRAVPVGIGQRRRVEPGRLGHKSCCARRWRIAPVPACRKPR